MPAVKDYVVFHDFKMVSEGSEDRVLLSNKIKAYVNQVDKEHQLSTVQLFNMSLKVNSED